MLITSGEAEQIALEITQKGGGDDRDPPPLRQVVRAAGMRIHITKGLVTESAKATVNGERGIYLRPRLHPVRARFVTLHEVVEEEFDRLGLHGDGREESVNYVAAAINCPRGAFLRAVHAGLTLSQLGALFIASQTMVALRRAELLKEPRAVVCPHRVYVRWDGLTEADARTVLAQRRPGVRKIRLTDQRHRVALALVG